MAIADAPDLSDRDEEEMRLRTITALDLLPRLTRAVYLLNCLDDLSYVEIAWRCGIGVDEVENRMSTALFRLNRYRSHGEANIAGRIRCAVRPWRDVWAHRQSRRRDRRLGIGQ